MKITKDQIDSIMSDYVKQYSAMMARSAANQQAFREGRPQPYQAQSYGVWNISDRD